MENSQLLSFRFPSSLVKRLDSFKALLPQANRTQVVIALLELAFEQDDDESLADSVFSRLFPCQSNKADDDSENFRTDVPFYLVLREMFKPCITDLLVASEERLSRLRRYYCDDCFTVVGSVCVIEGLYSSCTVMCPYYRVGTCCAITIRLSDGSVIQVTDFDDDLLTKYSHLYERIR